MKSTPASPPAAERSAACERPKVLLVEDHADMRAYLRKHLARDYEVREAARGDDGLSLVREEMPDVVVADIMMPGLDGSALCRAIKSDPETDFIPVILLTAKTDLASRLDGLEGGADDYLTKPFEPQELRLRIRNLLRARARLQARPAPAPATDAALPAESAEAALLRRLQAVLERQSQDAGFGVVKLAASLGISRAQLHRRLADACHATPAEVLMRFRLERAARMLSQQAGNVSEIAYAAGSKTLSHFVKRFRNRYQQTPAALAAELAKRVRPG